MCVLGPALTLCSLYKNVFRRRRDEEADAFVDGELFSFKAEHEEYGDGDNERNSEVCSQAPFVKHICVKPTHDVFR